MEYPFVSVIIVNYNGAHFLPVCLKALQAQTYPQDQFEVVVSDNASDDKSLKLLKHEYSWARVLENGENLGFASGNNVAIEATNGKYVVLLNNDTAPKPDWLENIVKVAENHPKAGMVTGHLQLFYDQLVVQLQSDTVIPPGDGRELGTQVFDVNSGAPRGVVQYLDGFYGWEPHPSGKQFRWTQEYAKVGVPIPYDTDEWTLTLTLAASRQTGEGIRCRVSVDDQLITILDISGSDPSDHFIKLSRAYHGNAKPVVQNTGSIVFKDGSSRDRGTYVWNSETLFETDEGQYDEVEEVFSGCGASLLIRREMVEEVGVFDDDFFMYYEDTDLAWRARIGDWKILYAPEALVRHIHCGTTEEWSPFFFFQIDRNRLAMVFKNGESRQIFCVYGRYLGRVALDGWIAIKALIRRVPNWRAHAGILRVKARVLISLLRWMPALWRKRQQVQTHRKVSPSDLKDWFVERN